MPIYVIFAWFFTILFGTANLFRLLSRNSIPAMNVVWFAIGVPGLVVHYIGY